MAELLECSLRTIDEYTRQGMPGEAPKRPGGQWQFSTAQVVGWLRTRERESALGEVVRLDETEAKRRKLAAEAAMAELELAKAEGVALSIQDFSRAWAAMIGAARAKLLGLGAKLGPSVAIVDSAAECDELIGTSIAEALQELSEFEPGIIRVESESDPESPGGDQESSEVVGTPAKPHRKRVGGRGKKTQQRVQRRAGEISNKPN